MANTRNRFKYRCADCGWTGFFYKGDFARRCRPHCGECGCTILDPVTKEAHDRALEHDAVLRDNKGYLTSRANCNAVTIGESA